MTEAADPLEDSGKDVLQTRRAFVEQWRSCLSGRGHETIANRNTVRRMIDIIDALASASSTQGRFAHLSADPAAVIRDDPTPTLECLSTAELVCGIQKA